MSKKVPEGDKYWFTAATRVFAWAGLYTGIKETSARYSKSWNTKAKRQGLTKIGACDEIVLFFIMLHVLRSDAIIPVEHSSGDW